MRRSFLVLFTCCLLSLAHGQSGYWQQEVNYIIDVSLNDKEHSLDAFEKIEYINHSPDTLTFIWFHIWPNAYKNDKTAFSDQLLVNSNTRFYFSGKEEKGFINRLDFKVNNITARTEDHPEHIDIIKLLLPVPLAPGQKTIITTPFHVKLPYNFSRGGHDGQSYQLTQWYPKPAVYDAGGWHPMPYLDQGEFYSEFGDFDVRITVPANYVVAATGELQEPDEKAWLKTRSSFAWIPIRHKTKIKGGGFKTTVQLFPESATQTKTLNYKQNRVHDFAWFADKRFIVKQDTCLLVSGRTIDVYSFYTPVYKYSWDSTIQYSKSAVRHYSSLVGEYPYNVVSVVQGPASFGGGMEYPTITIISSGQSRPDLDNTMAHEIGHNWFYGILASNERDHPWMDEGINTFYDNKYRAAKYGPGSQWERALFSTRAVTKRDQAISTSSEKFNAANYDLVAYYKTSEWMRYLESELGTAAFNNAMQEYFRRWQFKHPGPVDFQNVISETTGRNVDSIFSYLIKTGELPNQARKGTKTVFVFPVQSMRPYTQSLPKTLVTIGPAIGANSYDKFMIGAFVTNIERPPSPFKFFLAPMYATGSKKFAGLGFLVHTFYPHGFLRKVEIGVLGSAFTADKYTDNDDNKNFLGVRKIVPGIKLTKAQKDPRSHLTSYAQFKAFFFNEESIRFYRDTVISPPDTTILNKYRTINNDRTLYQLTLVAENNRALYPYRGELKIEKGKDFLRAAFTGNYFFNYPKQGGLDLRFFAGKFFYAGTKTISKEFDTDRYHLNMTGPNGYEDYTYSDYFIGRNKFEGFASQQIMMRDGGFKVRTDLLSEKVGKTDDWLVALNLTTTLPPGLNPLSGSPFANGLKLFADIGTYADAWKPNAESDRFLYNAGIQVSLYAGTINIYLPLIYSSVYKNYIQSILEKKNRWLRKISFSFDFSNFTFKKNFPDVYLF